uniref:Cytochrome P450 n=1 Tax=Kalanchoe fedtschenkoi TaxID=63787 RepID=A0A7N0V2L4_KALFE
MATLRYLSAVTFLLLGSYAAAPTSVRCAVTGLSVLALGALLALLALLYLKESAPRDGRRPPVAGSVFSMLIHFNHLYDYLVPFATKWKTFRFITPHRSEVFTADPVNVEYMLKTNFANYGKGEYHYGVMSDLLGDGIFAVDGEKWRHQRRLATLEFNTKVLRDFSTAVFLSNSVKLAANVLAAARGESVIDLQDVLLKSTLDSIFKVGFGADLNLLSGTDEFGTRFTKAFDDSNQITYSRYVDVFWKLKRFLNIGLEAELKKNIKIIDGFVYQLIRFKREQSKDAKHERGKEDILSRFLIESEKDPENMTDKYLRDITLNFIIAGRDTSANSLSWFFYMMCKHPQVQEKIISQVREATGANINDRRMPFGEFRERLTDQALERMHYLHAALTETMRLYPAVPLDGKAAEADDVLPDGLRIRKGDRLSYAPYVMGRMAYIWGGDAEEFHPERWLENGVFRPESPFKFATFQAGPRICVGKEFAYRQMKIIAATLLNFFQFKLADESREAKYRTMFTLHMDGGLPVRAYLRYAAS